ncbi:MAG: nuclear transport factor 2 family protein [Jiangellaceae bacterium]
MVTRESDRTRTSTALALGTVFRDAWVSRDLGRLATMLAPDCLYSTTSGPAPGTEYRGKQAVLAAFAAKLRDQDDHTRFGAVHAAGDDIALIEWAVYDDAGVVQTRGCDVVEFRGDQIVRKDAFRKVRT